MNAETWKKMVEVTRLQGAARQLANQAIFQDWIQPTNGVAIARLTLPEEWSLLRTAALIDKLAAALSWVVNKDVRVEISITKKPEPERTEKTVTIAETILMAKEFYETRNPTMNWSKLGIYEKIYMAVLAERSACMKVCREESLLAFERGYPETALKVAANCVDKIRERGVR